MLVLRERDVKQLLTVEEAIAVLERAFRAWAQGRALNRPRGRIRVPAGFLHLMAAAALDDGVMGFKAYATVSGAARFVIQLFDAERGRLLALIEADRLGQVRTGAASGLAAQHLARQDAQTVGIVGAGYQAETQLEAVCAVRPVRQVKVYSRTPERRERYAERMAQRLGLAVTPVATAEAAVTEAEIVITVTTARSPVLRGEWLRPGACVLAAGSNHWLRRELDPTALARAARVVVDDLDQAQGECGELMAAVEAGAVRWEAVTELRHVVAGALPGRTDPEEVLVFESQGIALEDVAVAAHVMRRARAAGLGQELAFGD